MLTEDVYWAILANVEQKQQRLLAEAKEVETQVRLVHFRNHVTPATG